MLIDALWRSGELASCRRRSLGEDHNTEFLVELQDLRSAEALNAPGGRRVAGLRLDQTGSDDRSLGRSWFSSGGNHATAVAGGPGGRGRAQSQPDSLARET